MQKLQMFALFDKKAVAYSLYYAMPQKGQVLRAMEDDVNNPQTAMSRHPEDYALYHIGEFDDASGSIKCLASPVHVEEALALKKVQK